MPQQQASHTTFLIVDDDDSIRLLFIQRLEDRGHKALGASSSQEAFQLMARNHFDFILLDQHLKNELGTELLEKFFEKSPFSRVVFLTSHESIQLATQALTMGASGFLIKSDPVNDNIDRLSEMIHQEGQSSYSELPSSDSIVGDSVAIKSVLHQALKVKNSDSTILLTGESGVGKEMFAKYIHEMSNRNLDTFIAINCAAISENLLEAELFGYKKGAFTDAKTDRKGYFETCTNGTLLLDEIGETTPSLQAKLLRVLQEKEITPVGSCHPIKVNTRVIAATNKNLLEEVKQKRFREDLYYRLAVVNLEVPPLRERAEDIPLLIEYFLKFFNKKFKKNVRPPDNQLNARLKAYPWPGNVRELYNAIERAVLLTDRNRLSVEDLIPNSSTRDLQSGSAVDASLLPFDYGAAKDVFEKKYVENLLRSTNYNVSDAAKISNQYRTNIYRLIKKHHIPIER